MSDKHQKTVQLRYLLPVKKLLIFDLDGTLAESKCSLSHEMAETLENALHSFSIAVISGGNYTQFQRQFLTSLHLPNDLLKKIYLFPTCATSFYRYDDGWQCVYCQELTTEQKTKILESFQKMFDEVGFSNSNPYGCLLEDRQTQITFSALGQEAPVEIKKVWDPDFSKRLRMMDILKQYIPEFEIRVGGSTSIDITRKGIDKAYGIEQIEQILGFQKEDMVFIGDALFEGGNDAPVKRTGVDCVSTSGPEETIQIIKSFK